MTSIGAQIKADAPEFRDPYPGVTAAPLNNPDMTSIVPLDKNFSFRGFNSNPHRMAQAKLQGWVLCEPKDCGIKLSDGRILPLPSEAIIDGVVRYGDLVFMKMPRARYEGALKHNHIQSVKNVHPDAAKKLAEGALAQSMGQVGAKAADKAKLTLDPNIRP
jgi:hypothetical protein